MKFLTENKNFPLVLKIIKISLLVLALFEIIAKLPAVFGHHYILTAVSDRTSFQFSFFLTALIYLGLTLIGQKDKELTLSFSALFGREISWLIGTAASVIKIVFFEDVFSVISMGLKTSVVICSALNLIFTIAFIAFALSEVISDIKKDRE